MLDEKVLEKNTLLLDYFAHYIRLNHRLFELFFARPYVVLDLHVDFLVAFLRKIVTAYLALELRRLVAFVFYVLDNASFVFVRFVTFFALKCVVDFNKL